MNKKTNKTWSRGRLVPFLSELLRQRILPPFKQARKGYINDMMDSVTIVVVIIALRNKKTEISVEIVEKKPNERLLCK